MKSLEASAQGGGSNINESSIMRVDESMVSGVDKIKDFFGSTLDNNDTANMLGALGDPKSAGAGAPTVLDINSAEASTGGA